MSVRRGIALLALVTLTASAAPSVPKQAPDVALTQLDGKPLRLSSYHGKWVVLDFFATWCGPCRDELPALKQLQRTEAAHGVQVIGISLDDSAEPVRAFVREMGVTYPVALGDEKVAEAFGGVLGLPMIFLIDPSGRIVTQQQGEGSLEAIRGALAHARK